MTKSIGPLELQILGDDNIFLHLSTPSHIWPLLRAKEREELARVCDPSTFHYLAALERLVRGASQFQYNYDGEVTIYRVVDGSSYVTWIAQRSPSPGLAEIFLPEHGWVSHYQGTPPGWDSLPDLYQALDVYAYTQLLDLPTSDPVTSEPVQHPGPDPALVDSYLEKLWSFQYDAEITVQRHLDSTDTPFWTATHMVRNVVLSFRSPEGMEQTGDDAWKAYPDPAVIRDWRHLPYLMQCLAAWNADTYDELVRAAHAKSTSSHASDVHQEVAQQLLDSVPVDLDELLGENPPLDLLTLLESLPSFQYDAQISVQRFIDADGVPYWSAFQRVPNPNLVKCFRASQANTTSSDEFWDDYPDPSVIHDWRNLPGLLRCLGEDTSQEEEVPSEAPQDSPFTLRLNDTLCVVCSDRETCASSTAHLTLEAEVLEEVFEPLTFTPVDSPCESCSECEACSQTTITPTDLKGKAPDDLQDSPTVKQRLTTVLEDILSQLRTEGNA